MFRSVFQLLIGSCIVRHVVVWCLEIELSYQLADLNGASNTPHMLAGLFDK